MPPEISVVVTVYNEDDSVGEVVRRAVTALEEAGRSWELILVDDGSTDATWAAVEGAHAADEERIHGVRLKLNFGQHPAMHAGLVWAQGDIVVTMDGDLQNAPEEIPKLVAAVDAGADVASGRRTVRRDSWGRTLPSLLVNGMLRRFTGVAISDFGCAFNAYRRSALEPALG
jgi:undecaprenyl-phosphate 4-deoxy-4-formamido-L-arabinose transferase